RPPAPLRADLPALGRAAARAGRRGPRPRPGAARSGLAPPPDRGGGGGARERPCRTWLLYMTCSAVAFAEGSIGLYQVLTRKHGDPVVSRAPHTREHLYGRAFL